MKHIVILLSGNGSNCQALLDACHRGKIKGTVVAVFSNNPQAYGLKRARLANVPAHALSSSAFSSRDDFDKQLMQDIDQYTPDLVVLAGYMRVLSTFFVARYAGRLLNIHPSLLPKYPGLYSHRRVLAAKDTEHGASVHFVTEHVDAGPVILQAKVPVFPDDNEKSLQDRVQEQEHRIYPQVVRWFVEGRLLMRNGIAQLDDQPLIFPKQACLSDVDDWRNGKQDKTKSYKSQ